MFELSAVAIIAGSMFGQPSINSRPLAPVGVQPGPPASAPSQPLAEAPAVPAPPPAAPAAHEFDLNVVRPSELSTRPSSRVAAFWFIIPGR